MARTGIHWIEPPERLANAIEEYGERVFVAVVAVAQYIAQRIQDDARVNAPWTDRTGNARSGLFGVVEEVSRDLVIIYLSHGHTVDYGVFLELAHGGRYAVIMPTIEAHLPELRQMLDQLFE